MHVPPREIGNLGAAGSLGSDPLAYFQDRHPFAAVEAIRDQLDPGHRLLTARLQGKAFSLHEETAADLDRLAAPNGEIQLGFDLAAVLLCFGDRGVGRSRDLEGQRESAM